MHQHDIHTVTHIRVELLHDPVHIEKEIKEPDLLDHDIPQYVLHADRIDIRAGRGITDSGQLERGGDDSRAGSPSDALRLGRLSYLERRRLLNPQILLASL